MTRENSSIVSLFTLFVLLLRLLLLLVLFRYDLICFLYVYMCVFFCSFSIIYIFLLCTRTHKSIHNNSANWNLKSRRDRWWWRWWDAMIDIAECFSAHRFFFSLSLSFFSKPLFFLFFFAVTVAEFDWKHNWICVCNRVYLRVCACARVCVCVLEATRKKAEKKKLISSFTPLFLSWNIQTSLSLFFFLVAFDGNQS